MVIINEEGSLYRWTKPVIQLFLETYQALESKFSSGKQSHKKTWEEIATVLKEEGYSMTGPQCSAKMRSLKKTYKEIKVHNNKSGNDPKTWELFEMMDQLFATKPWCAPLAVASSSGFSDSRDDTSSPVVFQSPKCSGQSTSKSSVTPFQQRKFDQTQEA